MAFFVQTTASFCKNLIITLGFEKNANFFAENWQKSQKIVIITSTPVTFGQLSASEIQVQNLTNFFLNHNIGPQFFSIPTKKNIRGKKIGCRRVTQK
jgi:hypothetical protein